MPGNRACRGICSSLFIPPYTLRFKAPAHGLLAFMQAHSNLPHKSAENALVVVQIFEQVGFLACRQYHLEWLVHSTQMLNSLGVRDTEDEERRTGAVLDAD